jgi:hypothetical protein
MISASTAEILALVRSGFRAQRSGARAQRSGARMDAEERSVLPVMRNLTLIDCAGFGKHEYEHEHRALRTSAKSLRSVS